MSPIQIAEIQLAAEKMERQKIANSFRMMAAQVESKSPAVADIMRELAAGVERGDYSNA